MNKKELIKKYKEIRARDEKEYIWVKGQIADTIRKKLDLWIKEDMISLKPTKPYVIKIFDVDLEKLLMEEIPILEEIKFDNSLIVIYDEESKEWIKDDIEYVFKLQGKAVEETYKIIDIKIRTILTTIQTILAEKGRLFLEFRDYLTSDGAVEWWLEQNGLLKTKGGETK